MIARAAERNRILNEILEQLKLLNKGIRLSEKQKENRAKRQDSQ